jgi:ribosomal protein L11 methylase PrmA
VPYKLTDRVTVRGVHEPASAGDIAIAPFASNSGYLWTNPTTIACLEALAVADVARRRVLDFGCGPAAILGLAALLVHRADSCVFVENLPSIHEAARRTIVANGLAPGRTALLARLAEVPGAPFAFALANVGDEALVEHVRKLAEHGVGTRRDGELIRW